MKYATTILFLFIVSIAMAHMPNEIRLVRKGDNTLVIECTPKIAVSSRMGFDGKKYVWFNYEGCRTIPDSATGRIRFIRLIPLIIPSSEFRLQMYNMQSKREIFDNLPTETVFISPYLKAKTSRGSTAHPVARLVDVAKRGNYYVGSLVIEPIQYLENQTIERYSKIVIQLTFNKKYENSVNPFGLFDWRYAKSLEQKRRSLTKNLTYVSPLSQGDWYRFEVTETGIYKLDYTFFTKNKIPSTVWTNIQRIRLYGNGGTVIPEDLTKYYPSDIQEISRIVVDKNNNGTFDADDYIAFYGCSTRGWQYDSINQTIHHNINPYTETNYYFITSSDTHGKSIDSIATVSGTNPYSPSDFLDGVFVEQEKNSLIHSGRKWVGQQFDANTRTANYYNTLSGLVTTQQIQYNFIFYSRSNTSDILTLSDNSTILASSQTLPLMHVDPADNVNEYAQKLSCSFTGFLSDNRSNVKIVYTLENSDATAWLDWIEILYHRRYEVVNDFLLCTSPDTTALVRYQISGLSSREVLVLDITDHANVERITPLDSNATDITVCAFNAWQTQGNKRKFAIVGPNGFRSISTAERVNNSDLHSTTNHANLIIISPKEFLTEANRLKTFHESHDNMQTYVADVQNIFNEFSGGLQDPMAIRNFLKFAKDNWSVSPDYVLLFGAGHCDYKNVSTQLHNWIIPYETDESNFQINSYCSDNYFVLLNPNDLRCSMALGRIPVRSEQDAAVAVDKIISYETSVPDVWRNRVTFVGDDEFSARTFGDSATVRKEYEFTEQSESLSRNYTPNSYDKNKIYLSEYTTINTASGRHKPDANQAIVDAINNGTLIMNYIGHGNDQVWAHEEVLTRVGSLPLLTNKDKLTFLVAATCDFALYDDPSILSGGEQIVTMEQGGAVLEVASCRPVYGDSNFSLNTTLFDEIFLQDSSGNSPSIGEAMQVVQQSFYDINSRKFHLFGDPTVHLNSPHFTSTLDSVNGKSTTQLDTIQSLGKARVVGSIRSGDGSVLSSFNGQGVFSIYSANQMVQFPNWPEADTFSLSGSILYSGSVSVINGTFKAIAPIPKDINFGNRTRMTLYAWTNSSDAVGFNENILISGTDTTVVDDHRGPKIYIYVDDVNFRSGDVVKPNSILLVKLKDNNGINTSTLGVGHGLVAQMTNPTSTIDLSNYYKGALDRYDSGEVHYTMENLQEGAHDLTVKAWDIFNNSSTSEITFVVKSGDETLMSSVLNYPNPFRRTTTFCFQRNSAEPVSVEIKIYSIAGRLLRKIESPSTTTRYVQIPWDGKDSDGDEVSNGIYFYRIVTKSLSTQSSNEYIGKAARVQ